MHCPIVQQVILPDDGGAQRNVPIACSARMLACIHPIFLEAGMRVNY